MRTLFLRDTQGPWVFAGLTIASLLLLAIDSATLWMAAPRQMASLVLLPVYVIADAPARFGRFVDDNASNRSNLMDERNGLRAEVERLNLELQRLAALESENSRLRLLLESKQRLALKVRAAEIVGVVPNPATRQVLLDKGSRDGVYIGQPVVDADGVVGQVVDVTPFSSRVMLITDAAHAVPATVVRSGFRVIVVGTGEPDMVEVRHITESGDIAEGDLLITSGLDQRFPAGYPLARIISISRDGGGAFVRVRALPLAKLARESHVLLVFTPPPRPMSPRVLDNPSEFALPAGTLPVQGALPTVAAAATAPVAAGPTLAPVSVPTTRPFVQPLLQPGVQPGVQPIGPTAGHATALQPTTALPGSVQSTPAQSTLAQPTLANGGVRADPTGVGPGGNMAGGAAPMGEAGRPPGAMAIGAPAARATTNADARPGAGTPAREPAPEAAAGADERAAAGEDEDAVTSDLLPIPARAPANPPSVSGSASGTASGAGARPMPSLAPR